MQSGGLKPPTLLDPQTFSTRAQDIRAKAQAIRDKAQAIRGKAQGIKAKWPIASELKPRISKLLNKKKI